MKSRTGQHQTINQSHCEADLNSLPQRAQHATGLRAMNEHLVTEARVTGGNHEWLAINREANMADETFVENLIDQFAVVAAARSEEHTSELQSRENLVCRLLLEKKKH